MTHAPRFLRSAGRLAAALSAIGLACLLLGCSKKTSDRSIVWITPAEAQAEASRGGSSFGFGSRATPIWVDPRPAAEFERERIAGAVSLPFPEMNDRAVPRLSGRDPIFVYGNDHGDPIAVSASKRLIEMGFRNVQTIQGGLRAWKRDGQPVESGPPPVR